MILGLPPGDARFLLVYFLKEAELNIFPFECTSVSCVTNECVRGPGGSEMTARVTLPWR